MAVRCAAAEVCLKYQQISTSSLKSVISTYRTLLKCYYRMNIAIYSMCCKLDFENFVFSGISSTISQQRKEFLRRNCDVVIGAISKVEYLGDIAFFSYKSKQL